MAVVVPFPPPRRAALPEAPTLVAGVAHAVWLSPDGEIAELSLADATQRARETPPLLVHAPANARRLRAERFAAYDVLELFAFARPANFVLPTPRGLAAILGLAAPTTLAEEALAVRRAAEQLIAELAATPRTGAGDLVALARTMARGGWRWGPSVLAALGDAPDAFQQATSRTA